MICIINQQIDKWLGSPRHFEESPVPILFFAVIAKKGSNPFLRAPRHCEERAWSRPFGKAIPGYEAEIKIVLENGIASLPYNDMVYNLLVLSN
jgi:hypothetical protein